MNMPFSLAAEPECEHGGGEVNGNQWIEFVNGDRQCLLNFCLQEQEAGRPVDVFICLEIDGKREQRAITFNATYKENQNTMGVFIDGQLTDMDEKLYEDSAMTLKVRAETFPVDAYHAFRNEITQNLPGPSAEQQ